MLKVKNHSAMDHFIQCLSEANDPKKQELDLFCK